LLYRIGLELGVEEADLVALRVDRYIAQGIARYHVGELILGPGHDADVDAELARDLLLALAGELVGRRVAVHDDVSALQVCADLAHTGGGQQLAQPRHRDPIARAEVYAP